MSYVRSILVRDGRGDQVTLYEFQDRRFLRNVRRLKLDSGELVEARDGAFVVVATGERLVPVGCD
ncbi:MAG TPA: hypothetical protein VNS53_07045 [Sphingomicrobium sp.]|nr:hypothetical protein [Sphingomicrobium sp.]